jgi:branched-chain amino acid transport system substrate-binding protein
MKRKVLSAIALSSLVVALSACGSSSDGGGGGGDSGSGGTVKIGAAIPLSGALAGFGSFQKWGYEAAVKDVNAEGGVTVGGKKQKVALTLLDDKTDPNVTSSSTTRLITKDGVSALLGSCTPELVNAGALIADRNKTPMVTGCNPLGAFTSVKDWTYVWDIFFAEEDLSEAPFLTLEAWDAQTNKKVAILHDNGPDGAIVGGKIWPAMAAKHGWDVVLNETFPTQASQFGAIVQKAKASGADLVLVDAITPQAISIRKQMQAANYTPKYLDIEKGAEPVQFQEALGDLANGVLVGGYWDPSFPYPGAADLRTRFEEETGQTYSQHIADSYAAARVLLDAITRANSTDKAKINDAIGKTDDTYVVGPVKFGPDHTSKLPIVMLQWQGTETPIVGPDKAQATGDLIELGQ